LIDDQKAICIGICHVLASLLGDQRAKALLALAMPLLDCLETVTEHANQAANLVLRKLAVNHRSTIHIDSRLQLAVHLSTIHIDTILQQSILASKLGLHPVTIADLSPGTSNSLLVTS
jgi:hypothetical protein